MLAVFVFIGSRLRKGGSVNFLNSIFFLNAGGNYGLTHIQKDEVNGKNNTGAATITIGFLYNL